jgi:hypothetical protein
MGINNCFASFFSTKSMLFIYLWLFLSSDLFTFKSTGKVQTFSLQYVPVLFANALLITRVAIL